MANSWPDFEAVIILDANGNQVTSFGGSGGTSSVDDAAFTVATDSGTPMMGVVTADAVDSGDVGVVGMDANRNLKVSIEADNAGIGGGTQYTEGAVDASITGTAAMMEVAGDTLQPVQGTVADGLLVNLGGNNDVTVTGTVTANAGTDLNTSALLTTAAHDAAFGTAGAADTQVRTVQGIASMTPLLVDGSATTQPVSGTVTANAGSGPWPVTDNSGSLTVDGGLTHNNAAPASTDNMGVLPAIANASAPTYTEGNQVLLSVNTGGALRVTGGGGGTEYVEDDVADANPTGTTQILVADSTPALEVAEADYVARRGTRYGAAYSQIVDSSGSFVDTFGGGTQYTEDAAAAADPVGNAKMLVRLDTPATITDTDGDNIAQRGTNYGAAYTQIVTSSGSFVDSFGGGTQYATDDALGATPTGTVAMAARDDALSALTPAEGDAVHLRTDSIGALWTRTIDSIEDSNNTTTSLLGISGVFTGTGTETLPYRSITIVIFADQDSATDGVSLQWSPDNTNWNHTATYTYTASTDMSLTASVRARYFRIVYTNGGTGQAAFRMYTFMHPNEVTGNVRPLEYTLTGQESAEVTRAVVAADQDGGGGYTNIGATAGGNLKTSMEEINGVAPSLNTGVRDAGTQRVTIATDDVVPASQSGTWNINDISGTVSLPTGAATEATLGGVLTTAAHDAAFGTAGTADTQVRTVQGIAGMTAVVVDGSAVTQPVSGTVTANAGTNLNTSALLTTAAHDAAFGTAGAADAQVRTVQGIASMTPLLVDGSAVTQPVSGTVTANPASGTIDTVTTVTTVSALGAGTTGPQKAEDAPSANADVGIPAMARRTAAPADTSDADLDYEMLQMDNGRLWTSATIDAALPAGDNNIGNVDIVSGTITTVTAVTDITNTIDSTISGAALTALQLIDNPVQVLGTDTYLEGTDSGMVVGVVRNDALAALANTDNEIAPMQVSALGGLWTHPHALNAGGCKWFSSNDIDETEEDVATGPCTVYSMYFWNSTAAPLYAQIFNTNTVTVGTTAPDLNFIIPANADSDGAGVVIPIPACGLEFATALTVAVTTGVGTDSGAPGLNAAGCIIGYED